MLIKKCAVCKKEKLTLSSFKTIRETLVCAFPHENPTASFPVKFITALDDFVIELLQSFLHFHHGKRYILTSHKELTNLPRQHSKGKFMKILKKIKM